MIEEPRWEADFARRRWPLMVGAVGRSLLGVSPKSNGRRYYHAIAAALLASVRSRTPTPIERFVQGEIWVEYHGLEYLLTNESFFGYYLHAFEPRTARDLLHRCGGVFIDGGAILVSTPSHCRSDLRP
jgi:hypothetical protein